MDGWQSHRTLEKVIHPNHSNYNSSTECERSESIYEEWPSIRNCCSSMAERRNQQEQMQPRTGRRSVTPTAVPADTPKSCRSNNPEMNFFLKGTPAPRLIRRPIKPRYQPQPPPNSPSSFSSRLRPPLVPLPIDRIMVLRERLDISSVCVSPNETGRSCDQYSFLHPQSNKSGRSKTSSKGRPLSVPSNLGLSFSKRTGSVASSNHNLSIDLTSFSDSDQDTIESSEDDRKYYHHSETESSRGTQYLSSPLFAPCQSKFQSLCKTSAYFSSETSSTCSKCEDSRRKLSMSSISNNKSSSSNYPASSPDNTSSSRTSTTHSRRSSDLICVYVDTVSNTHLAKYLRPCVTCSQPCCVCPESARSIQVSSRDEKPMITDIDENRKDNVEAKEPLCLDVNPLSLNTELSQRTSTTNETQSSKQDLCFKLVPNDKSPATKPEQHVFETSTYEGSDRSNVEANLHFSPKKDSDLSESCQFTFLRPQDQNDSGNCTVDEKSRSSILSRRHVSLSLMQLSTAAQCARILADSLEGVLQLAKEEVSSLADSPAQSDLDSTPDSLQNALDTLRRTYPKEKTEPIFSCLQDFSFSYGGGNSNYDDKAEISPENFLSALDSLKPTCPNASSHTDKCRFSDEFLGCSFSEVQRKDDEIENVNKTLTDFDQSNRGNLNGELANDNRVKEAPECDKKI